jgi:ATP-dependent RNA helicase RhlE
MLSGRTAATTPGRAVPDEEARFFDLLGGFVTFASLGLPAAILKGVRASGLTEPTAIQSKSIPVILQGNDLIGAAQSGSGKTGAYLLPILARLLDSVGRLRAIVVVPTRELAAYVETRARDYARFTDVRIAVVFTGAPLQQQERMLREREPDLLVSTPGRLLELHARGCLNFENVELLVLDEADRLVGLGLSPDLRRLLKLLPETRQSLMFSMTMPPELNRLAKDALIEPVRVDLAPVARPSAGITQAIYPVPRDLKPYLLHEMLSHSEVRNTIVCTRARPAADRLARQLTRRGYAVQVLDDHPSQGERELALEDLRRGRVQILATSDPAARSLDMTGVSHVVNFDVPQTPEDYVHRLGRGGRAEPMGDAFTLMSPEEEEDVADIERFLGRAIPRVMLPDFDYHMKPSEMRQPAAVEEEPARVPDRSVRQAGVLTAASRIAAIPVASGYGAKPGAKPSGSVFTSKPSAPSKTGGAVRSQNGRPKLPQHAASRANGHRPQPGRSRPEKGPAGRRMDARGQRSGSSSRASSRAVSARGVSARGAGSSRRRAGNAGNRKPKVRH